MGKFEDFYKDIRPAQYDLFLYTSKYDGTPNIVLEAAMSGCIIISSNIPGIKQIGIDPKLLIDDPSNSEAFIDAIRYVRKNLSKEQRKANALREKIMSEHGQEMFTQQVISMIGKNR